MKVLFVAAEAAPLVKVGGLGDVAGSLPPAISKLGIDIRLAIPWYPEIDTRKWQIRQENGYGVTVLGDTGIVTYLLAPEVFAKAGEHQAILATKEEERWFAKFSIAVVELVKTSSWKPEVLHANDWHAAEALAELEKIDRETLQSWGYSKGENFATLVTIHNLSYHTKVLKKAIHSADVINAVSPTYAREILTHEYAEGLQKELQARRGDIYGILNGIDYRVWDPAKDEMIFKFAPAYFQAGKAENKERLIKELGLGGERGGMLVAFVGRLDPHQKGVWIMVNSLERMVGMGVRVVVLGSGDRKAEKILREMGAQFSGRVSVTLKYDEQLAHRIYAGSDALLIPSRFEPCGLIQMIAMRYGTLPIAHAVGGLQDSITEGETGFLYADYYSRGLVRAVSRAKKVFDKDKDRWMRMAVRAMQADFSWGKSAGEYVALYEKALQKSS